jgi:Viral BACON domain
LPLLRWSRPGSVLQVAARTLPSLPHRLHRLASFNVSINASQFGPGGGKATATVTTAAACSWSASAEADWITIEGDSKHTGEGTVPMVITSFDGTTDRVATVTIAQQAFKLTQSGCSIQLSDRELSFAGEGGAADLRVEAPDTCRWAVEGNVSWRPSTHHRVRDLASRACGQTAISPPRHV